MSEITGLTYSTDIDYEFVKNASLQECIKYADDNFNIGNNGKVDMQKVANAMLSVCKTVGIMPDNEQLLFILANANRILCESCAGSGKTTISQLCVIKYKLTEHIPSREILCLAYNQNAVKDMQRRHEELVGVLNRSLQLTYKRMLEQGTTTKRWDEVKLDTSLRCTTIHALSLEWVKTYLNRFGIPESNGNKFVLEEDEGVRIIDKMARTLIDQINAAGTHHVYYTNDLASKLMQVYCFAKETISLNDPKQWALTISDSVNGLNTGELQTIFTAYERAKTAYKRMDFNDLLYAFYDLLRDPEVLRRIRANYKVILMDEYQDVTPAMLRIIKLIAEGSEDIGVERYDNLRLICVGDTDQSIYGYRGTDPLNCLRFKQDYKRPDVTDAAIVSMSVNRRCSEAVLEAARKVITSNPERIQKPINGIREGGEVRILRYTSDADQVRQIIEILKSIPEKERGDTCIGYRNNASSKYLGIRLLQAQIPFHNLRSDQALFQDRVSKLAKNVFLLFKYPDSKNVIVDVLYSVLPYSRTLNLEEIKRVVDSASDVNFWEINFKDYYGRVNNLESCLITLYNSYKLYKSGGVMATYMPQIFKMLRAKDYIYCKNASEQELNYLQYMQDWYTQPITIGELQTQTNKTYEKFNDAKVANCSVALSAFHSLKGLEFKHVILMDLSDPLFPGGELSRNKNASPQQINTIEKEARRLFYVAITRAKDNCYALFSQRVPTRYLSYLQEDSPTTKFKDLMENSSMETEEIGDFILDSTDIESLDETAPIAPQGVSELDALAAELDSQTAGNTDLWSAPFDTGVEARVIEVGTEPLGPGEAQENLTEPKSTTPEAKELIGGQSDLRSDEEGINNYFSAGNLKRFEQVPEARRATETLLKTIAKRTGGSVKD